MRPIPLLLLVACGRSGEIDFPDRLAPLEENRAPAVEPVNGDPFPELITFASGETDGLYWAHARAFVKADAAEVWLASRTVEVAVDRREVDEWTVTHDVLPEFHDSFTVHNTVHDVLTVSYDITWVHELQKGPPDAPERVVAQWDKTDGTTFIQTLAGSLVLEPVDEGVTAVELVEHLEASLRDEQTLIAYLGDFYADLLATVHDEPLPTFE